jgi:hypothetical protein
MNVNVQWRSSANVSNLHISWAAAKKQSLVDPRVAGLVEEAARDLAAAIEGTQLPPERFWRNLVPLAAKFESRRQLVEAAVVKTEGRSSRFEMVVTTIAAKVAAVEGAVKAALPTMEADLALRERPLREQWEARGPGMMQRIGKLTDQALIVEECEVLLVHPALGGYGEAHLPYNSARIEAVLANPHAELPESARLAWLIAQLQIDLPVFSENIHADRLPHVARFAMLVPALLAAESVELVRFSPALIGQAIDAWKLTAPPGVDAAPLVSEWWQTYLEARPPWRVALAALDQMFG